MAGFPLLLPLWFFISLNITCYKTSELLPAAFVFWGGGRCWLCARYRCLSLCLVVVTLYGVFTNHYSANGPSRCLLLELLDISVSELLLHSSNQGCSMWMIQHCARDVLEALAFLHHKGYVHADLKPRNILWSAEEECFKLIDFGLSFREGNQVWNVLLLRQMALC